MPLAAMVFYDRQHTGTVELYRGTGTVELQCRNRKAKTGVGVAIGNTARYPVSILQYDRHIIHTYVYMYIYIYIDVYIYRQLATYKW